MAAGEYDLALRAYLRAASEQGANADVLSALGTANLRLNRLGQSEQLLRRAVEMDERFVPAWNNLGVVLMETGQFSEASRVFRTAFGLSNGESDIVKANLQLALAKLEDPNYSVENSNFDLIRRGTSQYLLIPDQ